MTVKAADRSALERFLGLFTDVRAGEGPTALLLALNVFLILMAYTISRTSGLSRTPCEHSINRMRQSTICSVTSSTMP